MSARQVQALIAAGVKDPRLLEHWQRSPDMLRVAGIDPDSLDLNALRNFVGLSAKVRHNGIRGDLPLSFRLLSIAGIEIELFAAYAAHCAAGDHALAPTPNERAHDLIAFMDGWLDLSNKSHFLLWDIVRHEHTLSRMRRDEATLLRSANVDGSSWDQATAESIPVLNGVAIQHAMHCNPYDLASVLHQAIPRLDSVPILETYCCYWYAADTREIRLLQLDELGHFTIKGIDGKRTAADIFNDLLSDCRLLPRFLRALEQLAGIGIIRFHSDVTRPTNEAAVRR